jgi:hypothetical protein
MAGSATFTIVTSIVTRNRLRQQVASTALRRPGLISLFMHNDCGSTIISVQAGRRAASVPPRKSSPGTTASGASRTGWSIWRSSSRGARSRLERRDPRGRRRAGDASAAKRTFPALDRSSRPSRGRRKEVASVHRRDELEISPHFVDLDRLARGAAWAAPFSEAGHGFGDLLQRAALAGGVRALRRLTIEQGHGGHDPRLGVEETCPPWRPSYVNRAMTRPGGGESAQKGERK